MHTSDSTLKQCSRKDQCINPRGSVLPATNDHFHNDQTKKDGLSSTCKVCVRHRTAQWRRNNPERAQSNVVAWQKANPDKRKAISDRWRFKHADQVKAIGARYRQQNSDKERERHQRYREANKEKIASYNKRYRAIRRAERNEYNKAYYRKNPHIARAMWHRRRAIKANAMGSHTPEDIATLYKSQKGLCWWCGKHVGDDYHVDHRIPLSRGGSDNPENLVVSCVPCNESKWAKLPSEWSDRLL